MEMLRGILKPVPQSPKWHAEGDVFAHTRLVRKALSKAVSLIANVASQPHSAFSNLDMNLDDNAIDVLKLAAWFHDLGKETGTTVGPLNAEPENWKNVPNIDPNNHELHAKHHEKPFNFNPAFRKLMQSKLWQKVMEAQNFEDRKDLWFVIRNHMQLRDNLGNKILSRIVDQQGKYKNTRRVKLLVVFFLMDRIGRFGVGGGGGEHEAIESIGAMERAADKYAIRFKRQSEPAPNDPKEFAKIVPRNILPRALKGKFGREFSPEEIDDLLR